MASRSDITVDAVRTVTSDKQLNEQLTSAVTAGIAGEAQVFNTHSVALARELKAKADSIISQVADIDAKLKAFNNERTDLMLAYSMLSAAASAREKNQ